MLDVIEDALPLDLTNALAEPDWRARLTWPLTLNEQRLVARRPLDIFIGFSAEFKDWERNALLLACPLITSFARHVLDTASQFDASARAGKRGLSSSVMASALTGMDCAFGKRSAEAFWSASVPKRPWARRLARMGTWSGPAMFIRALLRPDVIAISHNSLLQSEAASQQQAVGYTYAASDLLAARRNAAPGAGARSDFARTMGLRLAKLLSEEPQLSSQTRAAVSVLLEAAAVESLRVAADDLACLARYRIRSPHGGLWSATGGAYPARAVGISAMSKGMNVRRHEHVGAGCLVADRKGFDSTERAVSSEVSVASPALARFAEIGRTEALAPLGSLRVGAGDPDFSFAAKPRPPRMRPRVMYATTILRGFRQYHDPIIADPVYLDWQMKVSETLARLPVDFVMKPHPSTRYPGGFNPLTAIAPVASGNFEALMPEVDIFVFDYGQTTTFWKGLATAQPFIYLDLGMSQFLPEVRAELERRAAVIPVSYNERNLPVLDEKALADAVMRAKSAPDDNVFPSWLAGAAR